LNYICIEKHFEAIHNNSFYFTASEQIFYLFLLESKGPSWPTIIKYAIGPSLLLVTWCLASKHL